MCIAQRQCKAAHVTYCVVFTSTVYRYSGFRPFVITYFVTIIAPVSLKDVHRCHAP